MNEIEERLIGASKSIRIPDMPFDFKEKRKTRFNPWMALAPLLSASLVLAIVLPLTLGKGEAGGPDPIIVDNREALSGPSLIFDAWEMEASAMSGERESHSIEITFFPYFERRGSFIGEGERFVDEGQELSLSLKRTVTMDGPVKYEHTVVNTATVYNETATLGEIFGGLRDWDSYLEGLLPITDEVESGILKGTGTLEYELSIVAADGGSINVDVVYEDEDGNVQTGPLYGGEGGLPYAGTSIAFHYEGDGNTSFLLAEAIPDDAVY